MVNLLIRVLDMCSPTSGPTMTPWEKRLAFARYVWDREEVPYEHGWILSKGFHADGKQGTKQFWVRCNYGINYTNDVPSSLKYHFSLTSRGYRALAYRWSPCRCWHHAWFMRGIYSSSGTQRRPWHDRAISGDTGVDQISQLLHRGRLAIVVCGWPSRRVSLYGHRNL